MRITDNGYVFEGDDVGLVVVVVTVDVVSPPCVSSSTSPPGTFGRVPDDRRDDARDGGRVWEWLLADVVQRARGFG